MNRFIAVVRIGKVLFIDCQVLIIVMLILYFFNGVQSWRWGWYSLLLAKSYVNISQVAELGSLQWRYVLRLAERRQAKETTSG